MGGGFKQKPKGPSPEDLEREELQKEEAERQEKSRDLMMRRLQVLRRRGGTTGGIDDQDTQQNIIGG